MPGSSTSSAPGMAAAVARHPEVVRARLVVSGEMADDRMTFVCEVGNLPQGEAERSLAAAIGDTVRGLTKLRADDVRFVARGTLPNDGKVIEDQRPVPG